MYFSRIILCIVLAKLSFCSTYKFPETILEQVYRVSSTQQPERFIIQFQADTADVAAVNGEQNAFKEYLEKHNVNYTIRYQYNNAINAISIKVYPSVLSIQTKQNSGEDFKPSVFLEESVKSLPYVERYWPGKRYARPRTFRSTSSHSSSKTDENGQPNLHAAHDMTGVTFARSLNLTGKGVKVGIIDTGVDYTHPALGGCFGENCLIKYGFDLVGDNYKGDGDEPEPDDDPMDQCDGHGTHVAGILSATDVQKGFEGVAPGVEALGVCIFGCTGGTNDDVILSAVDMAVRAKVDIINLSLGDGMSSWQEDAVAVALSNTAEKGIVAVVAQGNEGEDGIARSPSPSTGKNVISVASVDNNVKWAQYFEVQNIWSSTSNRSIEYSISKDSKFNFSGNMKMTHLHTNGADGLANVKNRYACHRIHQNLTGFILLVKRGKCSFGKKSMNAQNAGAAGVFVYNNENETQDLLSISMTDYSKVTIPVSSISHHDGYKLISLLKNSFNNGTTYLNVSFHDGMLPIESGGLVSRFSTWGPDPELHFKPDIAAIGGYIYSTYPLKLGGYSMMSGTSMATPYMSGCIALYIQATGVRSPIEIHKAFMNHAKPKFKSHSTSLESPIKQGSGLIQVDKALISRTTVNPFKLALNDTEFFSRNKTITVHNKSKYSMMYHFRHIPSIAYSGYDYLNSNVPIEEPKSLEANATVYFNPKNFTLKENQTLNIFIGFEAPQIITNLDQEQTHIIYGGFLRLHATTLENSSDTETLHIPYIGSLGKQRDLKLFDTKNDYPYIVSEGISKKDLYSHKMKNEKDVTIVNAQGSRHAANSTVLKYDFSKGDTLYLRNRLGSPTAELVSELLDMDNNVLGNLAGVGGHWLSRQDNSDENYDEKYDWKGQLLITSGSLKVPKGIYRIKLSALKILGDKNNPQDWENWYSPKIEVTG